MDNIEYKIFKTGYCFQNELFTILKGKNKRTRFYAMSVLLKHPNLGYILFDTGYSKAFFSATQKFPYLIYAKITPVVINENDSIKSQLEREGVSYDEIKYIIISHFHADHISGLNDFKNAKFLCLERAYKNIENKKSFNALKNGFLPDLLPDDFDKRVEFIKNKKIIEKYKPFSEVYDIFNDGSVLGVDLSGHAKGQMGIIINNTFFVSDACWYSRAYRENTPPPLWVRLVLGKNKEYLETLKKLHLFYKNNPDFKIIPSHCNEFWSKYV